MSGSSSSSSAAAVMAPLTKYDVFLSFRGEDTRKSFISHLYAGLDRKKINAFIDDRSLERGDEISPELCKAIEQSMIYVIVFSKDYASSRWCLDELVKIMECKKKYDHQRHVVPIFYYVEPATVRHQKESYADAFVKHQNRFPKEVIQIWKDALTEAAGISGWDSTAARSESDFVDDIAQDVLKKLNRSISIDYQGKVGIEEHILQVKSLLQLESEAVRIIGIWGMGGIGKTTLAQALHNNLGTQFSFRSCFLNAQQEIERIGVDSLRKKYLSELLEEEISSNGLHFAIERVKRAKVLLILDDLKISSQLQELIGGHGNFGQGSKVIVTSRDMQVLKNAEADEIYQVNEMSYQDSLRLFRLRAFKPNTPVEGYADLVKEVLKYAKGVPLALQVLGSLLYDKKRQVWESYLQKLRKLPNPQIINVLKVSYDGLDGEEKDIFLDIACFYVGWDKVVVMEFIDACGFSAKVGMDVLKDRGLISILEDEVVMHDLIQEMGKDIVHQQCANDPGKRSRLWDREQIYNVLKKNKGTDAIQCIFLDRCTTVQLHPNIFKSMPNLRMLSLGKIQSNVTLSAFLESFPDGLKVLHWARFPQRSLQLCPENLVELNMFASKLEQLWEDDQVFPNLKRLDLSGSKQLVQIPDLSMFPNIEDICLKGCGSLIEVHSSSFLNKLKCLWLNDCDELTSLNVPSNILSKSVGLVGLYFCHKLKTFSISRTEIVESRGSPHFDGCSGAKEIYDGGERGLIDKYKSLWGFAPSRSFHELCLLDLSHCKSLTSLPIDLCQLKFLKRLHLSSCINLKKFPEVEDMVENLVELILDDTAIQELPSSFHRLVGLEKLSLSGCSRLESIPWSIGRLTRLRELDLKFCVSLETFPSSIFKLKLTRLDLNCCLKLKTFPEILELAESFTCIDLSFTAVKELPSSLDFFVGLQTLCLEGCRYLESLPNSICNLKLLSQLDCSECALLTEIPNDIGRLSSLRNLRLQHTRIVNLPESIGHLSSLKSLDLRYNRIKNLPESIAHLSSLKSLYVSYTPIVNLPESIGHLSSLKSLDVSHTAIVNLPESIGHLSSLESLDVSFTRIVNLPESIVHISSLESLELGGCIKLECVPESIGHLSSLKSLDVSDTAIVNLPESIGHLSSLESLDVSCTRIVNLPKSIVHISSLESLELGGCIKLECVPQLPPFLDHLWAFSNCRKITRVISNSTFKHPSDSKKCTFQFNIRCNYDLPNAQCDVVVDARLRISEDAYRFVYYFFPGSAVPDCFPFRCEGDSVTMDKDSLNWRNGSRLIGFVMCFVLSHKDTESGCFRCSITFKSDGRTFTLYQDDHLGNSFYWSATQMGQIDRTFQWKYDLTESVDVGIFHGSSFTFEITDWWHLESSPEVKECGISPLYSSTSAPN